jgi:large subunit ribosomal protein L14
MINVESILKIADNSGGLFCGCIKILKISSRIGAIPGQTLTVSIKKNVFKKHVTKKSKIISKGQICKALLVCSVKGLKRWGNFFIKANSNKVVLLNQYNMPYATRLFGLVFREVRLKIFFNKVMSLAQISL